MIKTIEIAGIGLDNYSTREAITALERDLSDQGFHMIEEVNTDTLMLASSDETVRSALAAMNYTVISEVAILDAVGVGGYQRRWEVENHEFFHELMRRFERSRKMVCIIGDTGERTLAVQEKLAEMFPRITWAAYALDLASGGADSVVNEINAEAPDVLLSILPSPAQEAFVLENKDKLLASLWYGIGTMSLARPRWGILSMIGRHIRICKLEKQIHSFRQESAEDEQK